MDPLHQLLASHYADCYGMSPQDALELVTEAPVRVDAGGWISGPCQSDEEEPCHEASRPS